MAQVNMKYLPTPNREQVFNLDMLNGGLNISELDFRLKPNESPQMKNLIWRDGVLCSRYGQEWEATIPASQNRTAYAVYDTLFHGLALAHIDNKIYMHTIGGMSSWMSVGETTIPTNPGVFFQYNGVLYYKNRGGYFVIEYNEEHEWAYATPVTPYIPVTIINATPDSNSAFGGGDAYQPENRIQSKKTVWYNPSGNRSYYLPVQNVSNDFIEVVVNGSTMTRGADHDYTLDATNGVVYFTEGNAPSSTLGENTVQITYDKSDSNATKAYNSVMSCNLAATYGGTGELCVVMGGCEAQPNAIFWNAIGKGAAMDPTYFPMEQYQFVGSEEEPVTGFGKQQSFLVIFKEHSVGRVKQDIVEVDGRLRVDMPYVAINAKIGCDLPKTIQLIDNNLVWCNTEQGVHILKDSSYAYENNIECISIKVNGSRSNPALLSAVQNASPAMTGGGPCSLDDDKHYWLCVDGRCWVWDYENTSYNNPSWYYFTNVHAIGFCKEVDDIWHLNNSGFLTHFVRNYCDYDGAIDKSYRFATQYFGGYDRLKNINSVIISIRPDTNTETKITYLTDYEERRDLTDMSHHVWSLIPWDMNHWLLAGTGFGAVYRRRPMCRRVKHFTMQLDNAAPGEDLSIVSAQIFYNYQGRLR